ncbi:hypothetical protein Tco_1427391 [Tanacetum coccineum]
MMSTMEWNFEISGWSGPRYFVVFGNLADTIQKHPKLLHILRYAMREHFLLSLSPGVETKSYVLKQNCSVIRDLTIDSELPINQVIEGSAKLVICLKDYGSSSGLI